MRRLNAFQTTLACMILILFIPQLMAAQRGDGLIPSPKLLAESVHSISGQNQPLEQLPAEIENYLRYYELNYSNVLHEFRFIGTKNNRLFTHILRTPNPRGTILVLHGYDDHSASSAYIIAELIKANFSVYLFDLPGHGLSEGEPAAINSFSDYAKALSTAFSDMTNRMKGPWNFLGHSTGCSTVLEWLWEGNRGFSRVVLVSPLIRSSLYSLSEFGTATIGPLLNTVPRVYTPVTDDPELQNYVNFMEKKDPLQLQIASMKWVRALIAWNNSILKRPPLLSPLLILQGEKDTVVEWQTNLGFISNRIPNAKVIRLPRNTHIMFNEAAEKRRVTFPIIIDAFTNEDIPLFTAER